MAAPIEQEEEVITHLIFEDDMWKARFASDGRVYPVHESSLDVDFMKRAMEKCKRDSNHGMQVAVPKGKATRGMSNGEEAHQQLTRGRRSGLSHVPAGALYNPDAYCQRNAILLAFSTHLTETQLRHWSSTHGHRCWWRKCAKGLYQNGY